MALDKNSQPWAYKQEQSVIHSLHSASFDLFNMGISINGGTPSHDWDFASNKPSSYWGTPMIPHDYGNLHMVWKVLDIPSWLWRRQGAARPRSRHRTSCCGSGWCFPESFPPQDSDLGKIGHVGHLAGEKARTITYNTTCEKDTQLCQRFSICSVLFSS